jgi:hypothetical protein
MAVQIKYFVYGSTNDNRNNIMTGWNDVITKTLKIYFVFRRIWYISYHKLFIIGGAATTPRNLRSIIGRV